MVSGVGCALGVDCYNVSLNDNQLAGFAVKIFLKRGNLELRNSDAEVLGLGSACGILNCCCELEGDVFARLGNNNSNKIAFLLGKGNRGVVNRPFNSKFKVANVNVCYNVKACANLCSVILTIHIPKNIHRILKFFGSIAAAVIVPTIVYAGVGIVVGSFGGFNARHNAKAKNEGKNEK